MHTLPCSPSFTILSHFPFSTMALTRAPLLRPGMLMSLSQTLASSSRLSAPAAPLPSTRRGAKQYSARLFQGKGTEGKTYGEITKEKDVLLSGLPITATPADIKSFARETKTYNDIGRIEYIYTKSMRPSGKALVSFSSPIHARHFEASVHGRILGGRQLNAWLRSVDERKKLLLDTYGLWHSSYQIPLDLIEYETGKLVLLRNIPHDTFEGRLEERLAPRYDLRPQDRWRAKRTSYAGYLYDSKGYGGSHDAVLGGVLKLPKLHPDATTQSFIVRCQSASEAMRLVRRWHNTYFAPATFDIQDTGGRYRVAASILY